MRQVPPLKFRCLLWLEQKTPAQGGLFTEAHLRLLRRQGERAHRGYCTKERTPFQAIMDGLVAMRSETGVNPAAASVRISDHRRASTSEDLQPA